LAYGAQLPAGAELKIAADEHNRHESPGYKDKSFIQNNYALMDSWSQLIASAELGINGRLFDKYNR
jgi:hypothetical protein